MYMFDFIKKIRLYLYITFYRLLPIKRNKIILWANSFKQYGCSPKYITEYVLNNYPGRFELVWAFEDGVEIPSSIPEVIKIVRYFSLDYLRELHTAHFIICNMRTGDSYMWHKRNGQKYIQTWHSSLRLKKIEMDAQDNLPDSYIKCAIDDSAKIDLLLSGCEFSTKIFTDSFWYNGCILKSGTPRCDLFFENNSSVKQKVCGALGIDKAYKIFLYAPTFRNDKQASLHSLDFSEIKKTLTNKFGGDWIVVYRFHPNIISSYSFNEDAVDATNYSDMQELLAASDILVTDYSSCMFDMGVAKKPCLLYTSDLDNYIRNERGLYFNLSELPFPIATSNENLIELIMSFDIKGYQYKLYNFMKSVGSYENGSASSQVVSYILRNLS